MASSEPDENSRSGSDAISGSDARDNVKSPANGDPEVSTASKLTPEEQMALYEKQLKEDDWGHQPC